MAIRKPQIDHYINATLYYNAGGNAPPYSGSIAKDQKYFYTSNPDIQQHTFSFTLRAGLVSEVSDKRFKKWSLGNPGYTFNYTSNVICYSANEDGANVGTAYAVWESKITATITINYYNENGTLYNTRTYERYVWPESNTLDLDEQVPHKTYYNGYWTNASGTRITSVNYFPKPALHDFSFNVYAKYSKKTRSFVYNKNLEGYTVSNIPPTVNNWWCKDAYTISSIIPTTNKLNGFAEIFFKWNTKANGTGDSYDYNDPNHNTVPSTNTSATLNFYALWKRNFIYKPDSNSNETSSVVSRVEPGKSIKIQSKFTHKDDASYDYEIDYYTAGSSKYYVGQSYTITSDIEATVHWKKTVKKYKVTYNKNTTDTVTNMPEDQYKEHTSNLTLSSSQPTRTGYNFINWNTKANGSGTTYNPGDIYSTNKAVTLYAQWERKNIKITYKLNKGSGTLPGNNGEVIIEHGWGTNVTLDTTYYPNLTRKYYKCRGWNTNKDASSPITTLTNVTADNTDVFAIWTKKTLQVRYESDGVIVSDGNKYQGTEYVTKDDNDSAISGFRREGASLFGWAKEENSPTRYCALGEKIILPNQSDNSTFTLYPYWRNTFDAYYCKHITTTRGQRIIYQEDYIKKGGF